VSNRNRGKKDRHTTTPEGEKIQKLPFGVSFQKIVSHIDERGSLTPLLDTRWEWLKDPIVYSYIFMVRPSFTKGWAKHDLQEDRYYCISGEVLVVLYDERPDVPTQGLVVSITLSAYDKKLMNIPPGVWHAAKNIGQSDAVVINFPTVPYNHENPDKYRLPLDTDRIPYKFENPRGG